MTRRKNGGGRKGEIRRKESTNERKLKMERKGGRECREEG